MYEGNCNMKDLSDENFYYHKNTEKSVFITTNGCSENRFDCAKMQQFFLKNGWTITKNAKDADIILFNACGLTTIRENASINALFEMKTLKKESAEIIVWGCFPKINKTRISNAHNGIIFGRDEANRLENFFEANINSQDVNASFLSEPWDSQYTKPYNFYGRLKNFQKHIKKIAINHVFKDAQDSVSFVDTNNYFIKVSTGCLNACSYCGVRFSRGRVRSEAVQKIEENFIKGMEKGYRTFTLIGTDLGSYGRDLNTNLVALLNSLLKHRVDFKLRLPNINPRWLIKMLPEFKDIVSTGKVVLIGSAVQSGSNRILKRMKRHHSVEGYKDAVNTLIEAFPPLQIRTNIIIGFPSETGQDFRKTIQLMKEIDFTYADIHRYAQRPGTEAALMKDQVHPFVVESRYLRIMKTCALTYLKRKYGCIPTVAKLNIAESSA